MTLGNTVTTPNPTKNFYSPKMRLNKAESEGLGGQKFISFMTVKKNRSQSNVSLGPRDSDGEMRSIRKGTPGHCDSGALLRRRIENVQKVKGLFLKTRNYLDVEGVEGGELVGGLDGDLSAGVCEGWVDGGDHTMCYPWW